MGCIMHIPLVRKTVVHVGPIGTVLVDVGVPNTALHDDLHVIDFIETNLRS